VIKEINSDLESEYKMFRLLQGDVGSGKTIVALISALNVIESGYQVAFMAPTEILARQHYYLAKNLYSDKIKLEILTGKTDYYEKKRINKEINSKTVNIIFGTHSLFQI
jgi:ATP-dependent DNA helicase RecG